MLAVVLHGDSAASTYAPKASATERAHLGWSKPKKAWKARVQPVEGFDFARV